MADLLSGLVVAVSSTPVGTQTAADAASGSSVLVLDDTIDMASTGGQVTINGTVTAYTSSSDDDSTITLTTPLTALLAEGAEVMVYPPRVDTTALVLVDGASDPIPATVPWNMQDALPVGVREEEDREQVTLTRDGEWSWAVYNLDGQPLVRDGASTYNPLLLGYQLGNISWPDGNWTTVKWFVTESDDITYDGFSGHFIFTRPGIYDLRCSIAWESAGAGVVGARGLRPMWVDIFTGVNQLPLVRVPGSGVTGIEVSRHKRFEAGEHLYFEAIQTSGAALDVLAVNTSLSIMRVAG